MSYEELYLSANVVHTGDCCLIRDFIIEDVEGSS